jgi:hypothetical protein
MDVMRILLLLLLLLLLLWLLLLFSVPSPFDELHPDEGSDLRLFGDFF